MATDKKRWVVGISGASGMRYALRLLEVLSANQIESHVVISEAGLRVLAEEENKKISPSKMNAETLLGKALPGIIFYNPRDIGAAIASGSFETEGMVVCPCSMDTVAAIATGVSQNLLQRAADVTIKEGRKLVLVPRETPLSSIHLENMLKLSRLGVSLCAAMPGFYHQPKTLEDLIDMQVMKILDQMKVKVNLVPRWGEVSDKKLPQNVRRLPARVSRKVIELNHEV